MILIITSQETQMDRYPEKYRILHDINNRHGPPEGHQNVAAWHIMHIMHIIAFGKPWRYCMILIITSQETQMDRYPEKYRVRAYAAHQKATKCGPRP